MTPRSMTLHAIHAWKTLVAVAAAGLACAIAWAEAAPGGGTLDLTVPLKFERTLVGDPVTVYLLAPADEVPAAVAACYINWGAGWSQGSVRDIVGLQTQCEWSNAYEAAGTYIITAVMTDPTYGVRTRYQVVTVFDEPANPIPVLSRSARVDIVKQGDPASVGDNIMARLSIFSTEPLPAAEGFACSIDFGDPDHPGAVQGSITLREGTQIHCDCSHVYAKTGVYQVVAMLYHPVDGWLLRQGQVHIEQIRQWLLAGSGTYTTPPGSFAANPQLSGRVSLELDAGPDRLGTTRFALPGAPAFFTPVFLHQWSVDETYAFLYGYALDTANEQRLHRYRSSCAGALAASPTACGSSSGAKCPRPRPSCTTPSPAIPGTRSPPRRSRARSRSRAGPEAQHERPILRRAP